ncbi:MAG: PBSX family phage terminase large subunit [Coriobacteriales bacterium]|jgi:PBSX family phage terminase large subunit|nr:PBSX family phage terminase large subunit [Coriobacteriales bacterium]
MDGLTINQELYCQARLEGKTQRVAYRVAYPRSVKWKEAAVDSQAAILEANSKVSQRLAELKDEAARASKLTRTDLIDRIAKVNDRSLTALNATKHIDRGAGSLFTATARQLLEFGLLPDETQAAGFTADFGLLLPAAYIDVHRAIDDHAATDYAFSGGRGSGKSSAIALEVIKLLLRDRQHNAVVLRKVANTLRTSVYAKIKWAITTLGLAEDFRASLSPLGFTYRPTGQRIYFLGLDDAEKVKSFSTEQGYSAIVWFEEFTQFTPDDVRSVSQSLSRGGSIFWRFYSWNPPRSKSSWVNAWIDGRSTAEGSVAHHSDYTMVPVDWIGEQFIADALELREINELAYRHEYLGESVGTDGEVFQNIMLREIADEEIAAIPHIRCGLDWGFYPDPFVFGQVGYDPKTKTVYILDECFGTRLSDVEAATRAIEIMSEPRCDKDGNPLPDEGGKPICDFNARAPYNEVLCDSAEPKSIASFREMGINAVPVKKFRGSIDAGIKWLQTRAAIVIDHRRAPLSAAEFAAYEYEQAKDGAIKTYPDRDNHTIDKARYALAQFIANRKEV